MRKKSIVTKICCMLVLSQLWLSNDSNILAAGDEIVDLGVFLGVVVVVVVVVVFQ